MARPSHGGGGWAWTMSPLETAVAGFPVYAGCENGLTSCDVPGCRPGCQNCWKVDVRLIFFLCNVLPSDSPFKQSGHSICISVLCFTFLALFSQVKWKLLRKLYTIVSYSSFSFFNGNVGSLWKLTTSTRNASRNSRKIATSNMQILFRSSCSRKRFHFSPWAIEPSGEAERSRQGHRAQRN